MPQLKFNYKREDLIARIKENRDKHAEDFRGALEGYYIELEEQLGEIAKAAKKAAKQAEQQNDPDETHFYVKAQKPQEHTSAYDRVIDMLEMAQDAEIELVESDFARYVRDEWEWKDEFVASSEFYNAKLRSSRSG